MALSPTTRKFLDSRKQTYSQPQQRQNLRPTNMFQKGSYPTPTESTMDLLFGGEGETLIENTHLSSPTLQTSDVGDIVSSVMSELGMGEQPQQQRRMPMRRRRR